MEGFGGVKGEGRFKNNYLAERFRGGLVFKAHRVLYHATLGSRVLKKKEKVRGWEVGLLLPPNLLFRAPGQSSSVPLNLGSALLLVK